MFWRALSAKPAPASPPKAGEGPRSVEFDQISAALIDALQKGHRQSAKDALRRGKGELAKLELKRKQPVDREQAWHDLAREPHLTLNDVAFSEAGAFLETLDVLAKMLVDRLWAKMPAEWRSKRAAQVVEALTVRLARTASGADSYFALQSLLGLEDAAGGAFVLMPRHQRRGAAAMNGMDLALALRRGRLVARVRCRNDYGVHRMAEVDDEEAEKAILSAAARISPAARTEWLALCTVVTEDLDFSSPGASPNEPKRFLAISLDDVDDAPRSFFGECSTPGAAPASTPKRRSARRPSPP